MSGSKCIEAFKELEPVLCNEIFLDGEQFLYQLVSGEQRIRMLVSIGGKNKHVITIECNAIKDCYIGKDRNAKQFADSLVRIMTRMVKNSTFNNDDFEDTIDNAGTIKNSATEIKKTEVDSVDNNDRKNAILEIERKLMKNYEDSLECNPGNNMVQIVLCRNGDPICFAYVANEAIDKKYIGKSSEQKIKFIENFKLLMKRLIDNCKFKSSDFDGTYF